MDVSIFNQHMQNIFNNKRQTIEVDGFLHTVKNELGQMMCDSQNLQNCLGELRYFQKLEFFWLIAINS